MGLDFIKGEDMKGVFIFKRHSPGTKYGVGTYISTLVESIEKYEQFHIYIISYNKFNPNEIEYKENRINESYTEVNIPIIKYNPNFIPEKTILTLISHLIERYDDVVFHTNFYEEINLVKELKKHYTYPVVTTMHFSYKNSIDINTNIPLELIAKELKREKEYYTLSDKIICLNQSTKDQLICEYEIAAYKIEILKNGIKTKKIDKNLLQRESIRQNLGFNLNEKIILFVGRLEKKKGVFNLLKVFETAYNKDKLLRLILVGEGNYSEFLDKQRSLYGVISITGFISKERLEEIYQIADIGVLPSLNEQQPFVVLEMVNNEIPLIMSDIKPLQDLLTNEECLHLSFDISDNKTCESTADEILSLINNVEKCKNLSLNAKKRLKEEYSLEQMGEKMINTYLHINIQSFDCNNHTNA